MDDFSWLILVGDVVMEPPMETSHESFTFGAWEDAFSYFFSER